MADAALAQLVEHRIRNAGVTGSSPVSGTTYFMAHKQRQRRVPLRKAVRLGRRLGPAWGALSRKVGPAHSIPTEIGISTGSCEGTPYVGP